MPQQRFNFLMFTLITFYFLSGCTEKGHQLKIAISKAKPDEFYGNYPKWVAKGDSNAEIVNMYELGVDSALKVLENCDGLLVTGGADVYPGWYGKLADTARCGEFDLYRDTLEMELIKKAIKLNMPIIGICRGEQILNVTLGGSLIIDLPTDLDTLVIHQQDDWQNCFHQVDLIKGSLIAKLSASDGGIVNSNHHQAIDILAPNLVATSYSDDRSIESVEWKDASNNNFLIGVQWHPERLDSVNASLSLPIVREFIIRAREYKSSK